MKPFFILAVLAGCNCCNKKKEKKNKLRRVVAGKGKERGREKERWEKREKREEEQALTVFINETPISIDKPRPCCLNSLSAFIFPY